ncbi:CBS domain-containing protein [Roseospirillum parvum]|uniref:CBS domain-containing protein n=1 Tax=Roseospirillum parvum TaxID=83401 RepID=A0A1G7V8B7_9PROT|nr:CBS domain-containing protein [Roseospirillum parvum]SDG55589.1 CBS domain-containing protein [Roseospirillum parvum]
MPDKTFTPVSRVMNPPLIVDGLATVSEALGAMRQRGVSSVVINKRFESDEYGLVVISDIATKVAASNRPPHRVSVYEVMSKPVLTVRANMDIRYALRMLTQFRVSRALVLDKGELAGIVTMRDLTLAHLLGLPEDPPAKTLAGD